MVLSDFVVQLLTPEEFDSYWPFISKELDRIPHTWNIWWTKDSLYTGAMLGNFQVWVVGPKDKVCIVLFTQVANYPANRILHGIVILGNSLEEGISILDASLEKWARLQGCTLMEVVGRPGWERKLLPFGMKKSGVVLSRTINAERTQ